jgi:hypothetical protein
MGCQMDTPGSKPSEERSDYGGLSGVNDMRRFLVLAGSALMLTALQSGDATAQKSGYHRGGPSVVHGRTVRGGGWAGRPAYVGHGWGYRPQYSYRQRSSPGLGLAAGLAVGALAAGAVAATPYYEPYAYPAADPCLRQQQIWNGWGYEWQWVRVC